MALQQLGIGPQQQGKGFAMAELVIAPFFEPVENRVKLVFRLLGQLTEDRDVTGITDLL